jgi:hypothetical protein
MKPTGAAAVVPAHDGEWTDGVTMDRYIDMYIRRQTSICIDRPIGRPSDR